MKEVAITQVIFRSQSGDCTPEFEKRLDELDQLLKYHAKKLADEFGMEVEVEAA